MILYLDTSAFVRLYVDESGHDQVEREVRSAAQIASHLIAYVEMRAALARMRRTKRLRVPEARTVREHFERDCSNTLQVTPTAVLVRRAGDLAERFALRGYDSVHLAAAESLMAGSEDAGVGFLSFDIPLNRAAGALGLSLSPTL